MGLVLHRIAKCVKVEQHQYRPVVTNAPLRYQHISTETTETVDTDAPFKYQHVRTETTEIRKRTSTYVAHHRMPRTYSSHDLKVDESILADNQSTGGPLKKAGSTLGSIKDLTDDNEPEPECLRHTYEYYYEFDIPEDTYGASIFAIVTQMQDGCCGEQSPGITLIRSISAAVLMTLNLCIQFSVLCFVHHYVVQPAVRKVQMKYRDYHRDMFNADGQFDMSSWERYIGKEDLCQITMTSEYFFTVFCLLWTMSCLHEFRTSQRFFSNVYRMPAAIEESFEMLASIEDTQRIVALTRVTRLLLYIFVCVPKLLISIGLLVLGLRWLSATTSFQELVLNCVAMEFVIRIDDLLYLACLPESFRREVRDVDFFFRDAPKNRHDMICDRWKAYGLSTFYVGLSFAIVIGWITYFQDVLPPDINDVKIHCRRHVEEQVPICSRWRGGLDECFPFGK